MKKHRARTLNDAALLEILALSRDATAIYTGEEIIIEMANDRMIGFWGKDRSIIGMPLIEAVPELQGQEFVGIMQNVWRTGVTYEATERPAVLKVNDQLETFYFDFIYHAIRNPDGSIRCILHSATDVTEKVRYSHKLLEQEVEINVLSKQLTAYNEELTASHTLRQQLSDQLAINETIFRNIFEQAPLGLTWLSGPDMVVEQANDTILKIWGRMAKEVIGNPICKGRPELEGQIIPELLHKVYHTGHTQVNVEFKVYLKSGDGLREAYVNSVYSPIRDHLGAVAGILVIIDDVTERVAERKRRELMEEQFRISVESAELGTWYVDTQTREFVTSARLKEVFGFYPEDVMTLEDAIAQIREDYRDQVSAAIEAAIKNETSYNIEYPVIGYHDGKLRWLRATGKVYPAEMGAKSHFSGVVTEITERKLEEMRKNDFIAIVSHELRTPLTSAKAFVQMLRLKAQKAEDDFTGNVLQKVDRQIEKMTTLIKGFLDVARLEAGKIQLDKLHFVVNDLLTECAAEALLFTDGHRIEVMHGETLVAEGDRDKIGQVVTNFLSNAIKYSPKDSHIQVNCLKTDCQILVSVKDEGMGIKPQDRARLFNRFYRVENKYTKTISGFGIGLYLSAEIIRHHGGEIGVESTVGQGSTFYFRLPAE